MRSYTRPSVWALLFVTLLVRAAGAQGGPPPPPLQPLPPPPQPAENPVTTAKANLGKVLFWDEQLSSTRTVACGSCHQAATGGSDPRSTFASAHARHPGFDGVFNTADDVVGSPGVQQNNPDGSLVWSNTFGLGEQATGRHAPSHINAAYANELFWDGRAASSYADPLTGQVVIANRGALESQASAPPPNSVEMGHLGRDWNDIATRVTTATPLALSMLVPSALTTWIANRTYPDLFQEAFGSTQVTASRILMAIGSYERTLFSTQTPFDSLIAGTATLRPDEQAGFVLFGQTNCARCHGGALMADNAYHNTGVRPAAEDSGRALVTHNPQDAARFRTPSLRNVGLRKAFMHNGQMSTLADVVSFYNRGGDFNAPNKDPLIVPLNLSPAQQASLVAFMGRPLTDPRVAAATAPFDQPSLFSEGGYVPKVLLTGGVAGASGAPPQVAALEPPLAGNPQFTVGVFAAAGGASAVLVIDEAIPPTSGGIPASGSFARQAITLEGAGASGGRGSVTLAIPNDAALYGRTLYGRWYVSDAGASGGVAVSSPFQFTIFGPHGQGVSVTGAPPVAVGGARLYGSQPNPFRTNALVRFDLPTPTRVALNVYDVSGRLQRKLYRNPGAGAGAYAIPWDGRDDAGRAVAAGVYFYRLETERDVRTARAVRVP